MIESIRTDGQCLEAGAAQGYDGEAGVYDNEGNVGYAEGASTMMIENFDCNNMTENYSGHSVSQSTVQNRLVDNAGAAHTSALQTGAVAQDVSTQHEALKLKALVALIDGGQRMMIKAILCRDEHEVDMCSAGEDAWRMLSTQNQDAAWPYDVVFLDYYMQVCMLV